MDFSPDNCLRTVYPLPFAYDSDFNPPQRCFRLLRRMRCRLVQNPLRIDLPEGDVWDGNGEWNGSRVKRTEE